MLLIIEEDDVWEEVVNHGAGGAVAENCMRELDMVAMMCSLPLKTVVTRLALIRHQVSLFAGLLILVCWGGGGITVKI